MSLIHIIVLALVQGLTEFLPISSAAHLVLVPVLTDWPDQGLSFDIAVHVGTLVAVIVYFRRELINMTREWFASLLGGASTVNSRLAWAVLIGTVPVGLAGLFGKPYIETYLRSPRVIAVTSIVFGILLWVAYRYGRRQRDEYSLSWLDIIIIGCAQALALIPGTSRSGITITAALMRGLNAEASARFSFLLSIPVIVLAGLLLTKDAIAVGHAWHWQDLITGSIVSGVAAYFCIVYFLKLLNRLGMTPFVIYRLLLGGLLLVLYL
jgi:undecaprenyl-diphosphatase